jgi:hypothetical protein
MYPYPRDTTEILPAARVFFFNWTCIWPWSPQYHRTVRRVAPSSHDSLGKPWSGPALCVERRMRR